MLLNICFCDDSCTLLVSGNGQGFQFSAIMLLWFNQWSSHQLIPVIHGIAEHAILIIRLDMRGKFFLLIPFVYYMQMLKVLTILFRCHRSGFCQNQARANLDWEQGSVIATFCLY